MNQNYICYPKKKDGKAKAICLALLISSVVCFYLSTLFPAIKGLLQIFSFLLLFPFMQITNKHLMTSFRYALENGVLFFSSRQGKREKNLGSLTLTKNTLLLTEKKFSEKKGEFQIRSRFSFCQNLFSDETYYLLTPEEDGYLLLCFEPDETLVSLMEQIIKG